MRTLQSLGLAAATSFVVGPLLAWLRVVPGLWGFVLFALGGVVAIVVGILALIRALRGRGFDVGGAAALVVAVVFVAAAARGRGYPRINDFTTDLDDPPSFRHASTIPANSRRDLSYPTS